MVDDRNEIAEKLKALFASFSLEKKKALKRR